MVRCFVFITAFFTFALLAYAEDVLPPAKPAPQKPTLPEVHRPQKHCLPENETRDIVKEHHFREPFSALKLAAQHFKAEALSFKLCRIDDEFVYEILLLRKNGKFFHARVNVSNGKPAVKAKFDKN